MTESNLSSSLCPFSTRATEFDPHHISADLTSGDHLHQDISHRCNDHFDYIPGQYHEKCTHAIDKPKPSTNSTARIADGEPNSHHDITGPNFNAARQCPAPLIAQTHPIATVSAASTTVIVEQKLYGDNFVIGGSYTVIPGKPVTVINTPIEIRTSNSQAEVIFGTITISLQPNYHQTTHAPPVAPPLILTMATTMAMLGFRSEHVLEGQIIVPATVLVVNGETSSVIPVSGGTYNAVIPAPLSFREQMYTVNRAGHIIMGPEATLIPDGNPVLTGRSLASNPVGQQLRYRA
ncbi:hypothetical protein J3E71DRAFT_396704 [Bipolaris maydis]|nr:hypothetical protein J3E71DRAFT_396704 [Bipolaris maydis]